jgi:hypothetical protein
MECRECWHLLCLIKVTAGAAQAAYRQQLLEHQVKQHRNPAAALWPGKIVKIGGMR